MNNWLTSPVKMDGAFHLSAFHTILKMKYSALCQIRNRVWNEINLFKHIRWQVNKSANLAFIVTTFLDAEHVMPLYATVLKE